MKKLIYSIIFITHIIGILFLTKCEDGDYVWKLSSKKYTYVTISLSPTINTSTAIVTNTSLIFTFSQSMNPNTLGSNDLTLSSSSGTVNQSSYTWFWSYNNTILTFKAQSIGGNWPLTIDSIYTIRLNSANLRSVDENPMERDFTGSFTTSPIADTTAPSITAAVAVSGGVEVPLSGIITPLDGIRFRFSESMSRADVQNAFNLVINGLNRTPSSITWATVTTTDDQVTFNFSGAPSGSTTASLSSAAQDLAGNGVSNPVSPATATFSIGGGNVTDYIVNNITVPTSATPSGTVNGTGVGFTIQNLGNITGGNNITYNVYISSDNIIDGTDTLITSGSTGGLTGGGSTTIGVSTGSWPATTGGYYILVSVSSVDDLITGNNTGVSAQVAVGIPDYSVTSPVYPSGGPAGSAFTGSFNVSNTGSFAGIANYTVYLSKDTTIDGTDVVVTTGSTASINAGSNVAVNYNGNYPAAGTYYIIISLTGDTNTANNTALSTLLTVTAISVDYDIIPNFSPAGSITQGTPIGGSFNIQNIGISPGTQSINYTVYLSPNTTISQGDDVLTSGSIAPLAVGGSTTINIPGNWPLGASTYYIIVSINATDDTNSTNNIEISGVYSSTGNVDYMISSVLKTTNDHYVGNVSGDIVSGNFTVRNIGSVDGSSGFTYNIYLSSTNTTAGIIGTPIASGNYASTLVTGGFVVIPFTGNWPVGVGAVGTGRYLVVEITGVTGDSNATNNVNSTGGSFDILNLATPTGLAATPSEYYINLSYTASGGTPTYKIFRDGTEVMETTAISNVFVYGGSTKVAYAYTVSAIRSAGASTTQSTTSVNASRNGTLLWYEGFNSPTHTAFTFPGNGWIDDRGGNGENILISLTNYSGGQSLALSNNSVNYGFNDGVHYQFSPGISPSYIGFWLRKNSDWAQLMIDIGNNNLPATSGRAMAFFHNDANSGNRISYDNGGTWTGAAASLPINTWHHIEVKNINYSTSTYDLYLNNTLVATGLPFRNNIGSAINRIYISSDFYFATAYIDEIEFRY